MEVVRIHTLQESDQFQQLINVLGGDLNVGTRHYTKLVKEEQYSIVEDDCLEQGKPIIKIVECMKTFSTGIQEPIKDIALIQNAKDVYFTPNIFQVAKKRNSENVIALTSLWADIDLCTKQECMIALDNSGLPEPTAIIDSGGGFHLYWILGFKLPKSSYIDSWREVMTVITEKINDALPSGSEAHADSKVIDCARLLRIPSSFNCKRGRFSSFVKFNPELTYNFLDDFYYRFVRKRQFSKDNIVNIADYSGRHLVKRVDLEEFKHEIAKELKQKKSIDGQKHNYYNQYMREDIVILTNLRGGNMDGCRHYTLLSLKLLGETDSQLNFVNSLFTSPLSERELSAIQNSEYENKPRRKTVYDWLKVTIEEEQRLKVLTRETTAKIKKECTHRLERLAGRVEKCEVNVRRLYCGFYGNQTPLKQVEAANVIGIGTSTLRRHRTNIKDSDFMTEKTKLISTLLDIANDLVDTICLLIEDSSITCRLSELQQKALELQERTEFLKELVYDNAEYSDCQIKTEILEQKCISIVTMTTKAA